MSNTEMKNMIKCLAYAVMVIFLGGGVLAEEPAGEQVLPLEKGRDAYTPSMAFGKDSFLVAWQSGLLSPGELRKGPKYSGDIVGCRVDKKGKALDAKAFVISGAPDAQEMPRVAFGGGVFLVVWQDIRNGKDWDVYAARVSADGKVLDKDGILIAGGARNQAKPRLAWDGKTFLVVWQDGRSGKGWDVYGTRVSVLGQVLDKEGLLINSKAKSPAVAPFGDGRSLVVVVTCRLVRKPKPEKLPLGIIVADGKVLVAEDKTNVLLGVMTHREAGPMEPSPEPWQNPVAMAAGKDSFLMAWKTFNPYGRGWRGARRIKHMKGQAFSGLLLDAKGSRKAGVKLMGHHKSIRLVDPDVTWDGSAYVVAWHETLSNSKKRDYFDYDAIYTVRVAPNGKEIGTVMRLAGTFKAPARQACVASDGKGVTLIGYEKCPATSDVPIKIALQVMREK